MPLNPPESPLIFDASMESREEDEAETGQGLVETLHKIAEITYKDGHHAIRPVHAKSHGLLAGGQDSLYHSGAADRRTPDGLERTASGRSG